MCMDIFYVEKNVSFRAKGETKVISVKVEHIIPQTLINTEADLMLLFILILQLHNDSYNFTLGSLQMANYLIPHIFLN